jgi:hypothetical protein
MKLFGPVGRIKEIYTEFVEKIRRCSSSVRHFYERVKICLLVFEPLGSVVVFKTPTIKVCKGSSGVQNGETLLRVTSHCFVARLTVTAIKVRIISLDAFLLDTVIEPNWTA